MKRPWLSKQFTLTTARKPSSTSVTAAMKTPQRRQMRKSQVRVPNLYRSTSDQSSARTSNDPSGSESMRGLWLRQNEQVHARSKLSSGGFASRRRTWMLPQ